MLRYVLLWILRYPMAAIGLSYWAAWQTVFADNRIGSMLQALPWIWISFGLLELLSSRLPQ